MLKKDAFKNSYQKKKRKKKIPINPKQYRYREKCTYAQHDKAAKNQG